MACYSIGCLFDRLTDLIHGLHFEDIASICCLVMHDFHIVVVSMFLVGNSSFARQFFSPISVLSCQLLTPM